MLRHLLDSHNRTVISFSEETGIPRNTLQRWLSGRETDLANASRANAHALLVGLGISDEEAWAQFNIPEELRTEFRSDRALSTSLDGEFLHLPSPLYGEVNLPAGTTIRYARGGQGDFQLVRLSDGTYYVVRSTLDLRDAEVLGRLVGVSFGDGQSNPSTPAAPSRTRP